MDFYTPFPTENGVTALVEPLKSLLNEHGVKTSECEVTVRPKFVRNNIQASNTQMLNYFRKGFDYFSGFNSGQNFAPVSMLK